MTNSLFFAAADELSGIQPGTDFVLRGAEGRHAAGVKRLQPGEVVDVADGVGRRISGPVISSSGVELTLQISSVYDEPTPNPKLVLVQALAKGGRDELAIEAATELGIDGIVPWQAERSIVRWKADKAAKGRQKWTGTVLTAAKLARRATIPEVFEAADDRALLALVQAAEVAFVLHEDAAEPLGDAVERLTGALLPGVSERSEDTAQQRHPPRRVLLIVGPEGGISPAETERLVVAGAVAVRMGPHVLRSSTAGPAALAVLSERLGRWS